MYRRAVIAGVALLVSSVGGCRRPSSRDDGSPTAEQPPSRTGPSAGAATAAGGSRSGDGPSEPSPTAAGESRSRTSPPESSPTRTGEPTESATNTPPPVEVALASSGGGWRPPYTVRVEPGRVVYTVDCRGGVERTRSLSDEEYAATRQRVLDAEPASWAESYRCRCGNDVEVFEVTATVGDTEYETRLDPLAETPTALARLEAHLREYADAFEERATCPTETAVANEAGQ